MVREWHHKVDPCPLCAPGQMIRSSEIVFTSAKRPVFSSVSHPRCWQCSKRRNPCEVSRRGDAHGACGMRRAALCVRSLVPAWLTEAETPWRASEGFTAQCALTNPSGFTFLALKKRPGVTRYTTAQPIAGDDIFKNDNKNEERYNGGLRVKNGWNEIKMSNAE